MPTIFSHAAISLFAGGALGRRRIAPALAIIGGALAALPDLDVIGFPLGVGYASQWGHRGFTHSLAFAFGVVGLIALVWPRARRPAAFAFLFACAVSHPLLDMLTDGGQGVMLLWPFDHQRLFLDWQPIRVSPIGARFFSARGLETVYSELLLIWLPGLAMMTAAWFWRRWRRQEVGASSKRP
ncbi:MULTISPECIES: metal-dependent hydrolase [Sphingobium]|uniref:metal-dependent hydrolase n=1 Tax=Sphingobium TaxID=165695 RepID=UPI0015EB6661|nr:MULTISPECIES: metal-dependent hydrolase [Sphingobium]MCW2363086.1 inner membrane protein [Sphingobium sp. B10D3B]MCW2396565.1 inner membrane protein [Sphingobium sp. B8D3B]MCW2400234.1 inner membrane protein [Sphingobium sp. B10D7B]MCW2407212.1 inner membrane protein [Sphingobium xanthum]MCW2420082.1 inner membrane protein [Sphingobium sp. B8D3C]